MRVCIYIYILFIEIQFNNYAFNAVFIHTLLNISYITFVYSRSNHSDSIVKWVYTIKIDRAICIKN